MQPFVICSGPDAGKAKILVTDYVDGRQRKRIMQQTFINQEAARRRIEEANDPI